MSDTPPASTRQHRSKALSLLTLLGTAAIALAFVVAGNELRATRARVETLRRDTLVLRSHADSLKRETAGLREALTAARAAITAYHAGDYMGAVALYDSVLRQDSTNAYLLNLRAYSLFKAGRIGEALRSQELSIRADSTYAWGYVDMVRFECASKRWAAAKATLDRLLVVAPAMRRTLDGDAEFRRLCRPIYP